MKYKTISKIARNYVVPAMIGLSALVGSGCEKTDIVLPVNEEVRNKVQGSYRTEIESQIKSLEPVYKNSLSQLEHSFNEYISDRKFTVEEQQKIIDSVIGIEQKIGSLNSLYEKINMCISPEFNPKYTSLSLENSTQKLYSLINENLNGVDYFTPELEKEFRKEGLQIDVEKNEKVTHKEFPIGFGAFILAIITFLGTATYFSEKNKRGQN